MMEIAGEEHQQWQGFDCLAPPLLVFFTNRLNSPQSFAESKTKQTEN
jgi:hypothetical protein